LSRIIGIDLGTTNSIMAAIEDGKPIIIPNSLGERSTPSVVAFNINSRKLLIGTPAKRQAITNPQNTLSSTKNFMGPKFSMGIKNDIRFAPYNIRITNDSQVYIGLGERWYSAPEVFGMILRKLKWDAEDYLGEPITQAVVTVPALFNYIHRQDIKKAGQISGLEVLRLINESTAAILAYGFNNKIDKTIAVYHLGGGTFDISIINVGEGVFEVISTSGTPLGGDDFDLRITEWIYDNFKKEQGFDLRADKIALQRLKEAVEKAKCELSTFDQTDIHIPKIISQASDYIDLNVNLTRSKLLYLVNDLIEKTLKQCELALNDAGLEVTDIDEIIMVGQQTRMPAVQEAVKDFFGISPLTGVDTAEAVALGAAIQAGILEGEIKDILLLDVTPLSLGVKTSGNVMTKLINRNTTIPAKRSNLFSTFTDNQTRVEIHIIQGEKIVADDNVTLGKFCLEGIPPAPKGTQNIQISFEIDVNGFLHVTAMDMSTGQDKKEAINAHGAIIYIDDLKEPITLIDAEAIINMAEKKLYDQSKRLSIDIIKLINSNISNLRTSSKDKNLSTIQNNIQELEKTLHCIEILWENCTIEDVRRCVKKTILEKDEIYRSKKWVDKLLGRRY